MNCCNIYIVMLRASVFGNTLCLRQTHPNVYQDKILNPSAVCGADLE